MKKNYLVQDVISVMQEIAPIEIACEWDHVGLMIGDAGAQVSGVMLALDANRAAIDAAIHAKANMLITHHPLFFSPVREIDYQTSKGANIRKLIQNDIHVFSAHTNLDKAKNGVNHALAKELDLVMPMLLEGAEVGLCGSLGDDSRKLFDYAEYVKLQLGATGVILNTDENREISRVFIQGGAFEEEVIPILKLARIGCVVTGEMKHHHMIELEEAGIAVIVCGHEVTERIVLPSLKEQLLHKLPNLPISVFSGHKW